VARQVAVVVTAGVKPLSCSARLSCLGGPWLRNESGGPRAGRLVYPWRAEHRRRRVVLPRQSSHFLFLFGAELGGAEIAERRVRAPCVVPVNPGCSLRVSSGLDCDAVREACAW